MFSLHWTVRGIAKRNISIKVLHCRLQSLFFQNIFNTKSIHFRMDSWINDIRNKKKLQHLHFSSQNIRILIIVPLLCLMPISAISFQQWGPDKDFPGPFHWLPNSFHQTQKILTSIFCGAFPQHWSDEWSLSPHAAKLKCCWVVPKSHNKFKLFNFSKYMSFHHFSLKCGQNSF